MILSKILRTVLALHPDHNPKILHGRGLCKDAGPLLSPFRQLKKPAISVQKKLLSNNHCTICLNFVSSLSATTHRSLSTLVLFASNKNHPPSFPVDPLALSLYLSLSLTNSITTQPTKLIDPKEVQIFPPRNATKVTIHNNARENNCGVIPKSFGKIMVPIWKSLNSQVAGSCRRLRRADPYADNCPCFSLRTPACPAHPKI
jgi:hypothetical protein